MSTETPESPPTATPPGAPEAPTTNTALPGIARTVSEIGAKVAAARAERGWSLAQLALRSGLSAAAVHKVEKSSMTPTISTLMKLASALGRPVAHFIDERDHVHDVRVVRSDEHEPISTSKVGLSLRNLTGRYGPFLIAGAEATIAPRADSGAVPMRHAGEELVILQEGRMTFVVAGERHDLAAGDAIHLRTHHPHSWANPDDAPARALWLFGRS